MPVIDPAQLDLDENEEVVNLEEATPKYEAPKSELEKEAQEIELPDKFKGKSLKDVVDSYTNLEKEFGRRNKEIGELRQLTDQIIKNQLVNQPKKDVQQIDYFADPENAVNQAIENHPKLQQMEVERQRLQQQSNLAQLTQMHPDFGDIVQNPDFQEWVGKSKVRSRLMQVADANYDLDAADELFSNWKERQQLRKTAEVEIKEKQKREEAFKSAKTTSGASTESPSKKIYRRADLMKLQINDPDRYLAMSDEIMQAYMDGRVK